MHACALAQNLTKNGGVTYGSKAKEGKEAGKTQGGKETTLAGVAQENTKVISAPPVFFN